MVLFYCLRNNGFGAAITQRGAGARGRREAVKIRGKWYEIILFFSDGGSLFTIHVSVQFS
jgi:hypothetical protein